MTGLATSHDGEDDEEDELDSYVAPGGGYQSEVLLERRCGLGNRT